VPGKNLGLTIERAMVRVFADDDMGDQRLGGHAAIDRTVRRRGLHDGALAGPAAITGPAGDDHLELGRNDVELLGNILADDVHRAAAAGTRLALGLDDDLLARQILRQIATVAPAGWRRRGCAGLSCLHRIRGGLGHADRLFEVLQPELQLLGVALLRAPAVKRALKLPDQEAQLVDLRPARIRSGLQPVALGTEQAELFVALGEPPAQRRHLVRLIGEFLSHANSLGVDHHGLQRDQPQLGNPAAERSRPVPVPSRRSTSRSGTGGAS
jgi:hypothetical protein